MNPVPLEEIIRQRRSVRIFDETHDFDHHAVTKALELAMLAPNSSNLQTWEFYRIRSKEKISRLHPLCFYQNACRTASELVLFVSRRDKWKERCQWHLADIRKQLAEGSKNEKRLKKGLAYYGLTIPLAYRSDAFGFFSFVRFLIILYRDLIRKPIIRWVSKQDTRVVSHKSLALAAENFMLSIKAQSYDTCPMEGFDEKKVKKLLKLDKKAEISMIIACGKGKPEGIYYERRRLAYEDVVFEL